MSRRSWRRSCKSCAGRSPCSAPAWSGHKTGAVPGSSEPSKRRKGAKNGSKAATPAQIPASRRTPRCPSAAEAIPAAPATGRRCRIPAPARNTRSAPGWCTETRPGAPPTPRSAQDVRKRVRSVAYTSTLQSSIITGLSCFARGMKQEEPGVWKLPALWKGAARKWRRDR